MHAGVSMGMVFAANVLMRILARLVNRRTTSPTEIETSYQVRVICREADETHIRTLLLYLVNSMALTLHALSSADMDGPLPIRQRTAKENTPSMRAFVEASEAIGLTHVSDVNGATQHGVGPYPLNVVDGVRSNTGMAYLTAAVRARPNVAIRADAEVDSVVIEGTRAVGVTLVDGEVLSAGEVILAAGTFGSPAILMRSGIGPSPHLSELGITTIADLPVGHRLQDQPVFLQCLCTDARRERDDAGRRRDHLDTLADRGAWRSRPAHLGHASHRPAREPDRRRHRPRLRRDAAEVDRPAAPVEPGSTRGAPHPLPLLR